MTKGLEPVEKDVYSVLSRIIPMCSWSPPPFVVGTVASIAPSSRVSWFMSSSVGWPSILVMSNFSRLSSMSCLIPMVDGECCLSFCEEKELIATARQRQKISCNNQVAINL